MVGVGYRANLQGKRLELQVGFSHPVQMEATEGIDFEVPEPTKIIISGIDKERVGQMAAKPGEIKLVSAFCSRHDDPIWSRQRVYEWPTGGRTINNHGFVGR